MLEPANGPPAVRSVAGHVARHYGTDLERVVSHRRHMPDVVRARQVAHYLAVELTDRTFPEIGRALDRDPTTIHHNWRTVRNRVAADPALRDEIGAIAAAVTASPLCTLTAFVEAVEALPGPELVGAMRAEMARHGGGWWTGDGNAPGSHIVAISLHRVFATGLTVAEACSAWRVAARRVVDTLTTIQTEEYP